MLFGMELVLKAKDPGLKLMIITDNLGEAVGDRYIHSLLCPTHQSIYRHAHGRQ